MHGLQQKVCGLGHEHWGLGLGLVDKDSDWNPQDSNLVDSLQNWCQYPTQATYWAELVVTMLWIEWTLIHASRRYLHVFVNMTGHVGTSGAEDACVFLFLIRGAKVCFAPQKEHTFYEITGRLLSVCTNVGNHLEWRTLLTSIKIDPKP